MSLAKYSLKVLRHQFRSGYNRRLINLLHLAELTARDDHIRLFLSPFSSLAPVLSTLLPFSLTLGFAPLCNRRGSPSLLYPRIHRQDAVVIGLSEAAAGMSTAIPSWKDRSQGSFSRIHLQVPWRLIQLLVPHRLRRKLRSKLRNRQSPASSIAALQTSFSPTHTIRALQSHRWSLYDGQYLLLALLGIFSLCVIQSPGPLVKTTVATLLLTSLVLPITRQFFLPFLPVAAYLILFYTAS